MEETEFIEKLNEATGKSIDNGDYGFIMGRSTPYTDSRGFNSADRLPGWMVWKKDGSEQYFTGSGVDNWDSLVEFLKA